MKKKHLLKVIGYSFGLFLFLWLMSNIAFSITETNVLHGLQDVHDQEMEVESEISRTKSQIEEKEALLSDLKMRLEQLRIEREELVEQKNDIINGWDVSTSPPDGEGLCYKNTAGDDQNEFVRIASEISGNDVQFLALLDAENGMWTADRVHNDGHGRGYCGIDDRYHPEVVSYPNFLDPQWQIQKCYDYYIGGVTFYGDWWNHTKYFTCP